MKDILKVMQKELMGQKLFTSQSKQKVVKKKDWK